MALNCAVVGMGGIGNTHATCYKNDPLANLIAVCDIVKEKADAAADISGVQSFGPAKITLLLTRALCCKQELQVQFQLPFAEPVHDKILAVSKAQVNFPLDFGPENNIAPGTCSLQISEINKRDAF